MTDEAIVERYRPDAFRPKGPSRERSIMLEALERWHDPVKFCEDVLQVKLWRAQRDILRAVAKHPRVTIRSGQKTSKSTTMALLALWWICTRDNARVIITASSHRQVEGVIWREVQRFYRGARWPLGGKMFARAETGLKFSDGRDLVGFATTEPERFAGFSSSNLLFIADEASGIDNALFEAMEGNLAGGGHIVLVSNPTRRIGRFWETFQGDASDYHQLHISSWDAAREGTAELGDGVGIATEAWCEARRKEWGEDDARYRVRVLGEFPLGTDQSFIDQQIAESAVKRWAYDPESVPGGGGPLRIGVDVARYGGDVSVIFCARGNWVSEPVVLRKADTFEVAQAVKQIARRERKPGETPVIRVDIMMVGGGVSDHLRHDPEFDCILEDVNFGSKTDVDGYARLRDLLWASMREWLQAGGAIPPHRTLLEDISAPTYGFNANNDLAVESKEIVRKRLSRSTDYADALALAVYDEARMRGTMDLESILNANAGRH